MYIDKLSLKQRSLIMPEIKYEVVKELGKLSSMDSGWAKEINLVSWNDREPVYDIRTWNQNHDRMGKGVTLTASEIKELAAILAGLEL